MCILMRLLTFVLVFVKDIALILRVIHIFAS